MNVNDSKLFIEHYTNLLNEPKAIQNPKEMLEILNQTFEALGSLQTGAPMQLKIEGRAISVNSLKHRDLETFVKLTKKFMRNVEVSEEQAEVMRDKLEVIKQRNFYSLRHLADVEKELPLHTLLKPQQQGEVMSVGEEASNRILKALKSEQEGARDLKTKVDQLKRSDKIKRAVGIGLIVGGAVAFIGVLATLLVFAAPLAGLAAIASVPFFLGVFLASGVFSSEKNGFLRPLEANLQSNLEKFVQLEKYKKAVAEPDFDEFAKDPANNYERLKVDDTTFYKFLDLYILQKNYEKELKIVQENLSRIDQSKLIQSVMVMKEMEPQISNLNSNLMQVNMLRNAIQLQPLSKPDF